MHLLGRKLNEPVHGFLALSTEELSQVFLLATHRILRDNTTNTVSSVLFHFIAHLETEPLP